MASRNKCLLCGSDNTGLFLHTKDFFLSAEEFSIYKCRACGFVFTQDPPDPENEGKYYDSDTYLSHSDTSTGIAARLYRAARKLMLKRKRDIIENATGLKSGILLDIGSGSGYFAGEMKKAGWQVAAVEINEPARKFSSAKFDIYPLPPEKINELPSSGFDCITLWHVLEHFSDPLGYASEIFRLLRTDGICIVALPNCSSFDADYYREHWAAYDLPRHQWHFTPETFRKFADNTGFSISDVSSLPLDVFFISSLSEKYKGSMFHFVMGILRGSFFAFRAAFRREKSSSLIYILRKRII